MFDSKEISGLHSPTKSIVRRLGIALSRFDRGVPKKALDGEEVALSPIGGGRESVPQCVKSPRRRKGRRSKLGDVSRR